MNARSVLGAVALAAGAVAAQSAAAAGCTDTFNLTSMGPPAVTTIGNSFQGGAGHFDDCYNFTLSNSAEAFGLTLEWDMSLTSGIDVGQVALSGGSLSDPVVDDSPGWFSFSHLLAGTYQLIVSGDVTNPWKFDVGSVGYAGLLATTRSFAAPVPEPETYAMLALGLAVVGWSAKRRNA